MKLRLTRPQSERNLLAGITAALDELERRIAYGTATWTFTGFTGTASIQVAHELGLVPVAIIVTPGIDNGLNLPPSVQVTAKDATNFTVLAATVDAQVPGFGDNCAFSWVAIV